LASNRRGAALSEYVLLVALVLIGLIGILFGMQSHLGKIYTNANSQIGMADCAASGASCSGASSGGGAAGGSGSGGSAGSAAAASGSSGTGSGGIVLGDDTPTNTPDASAGAGTGSGGGSGGSQPQPGIHVPTQ
jgi:Flp pilus assembly pilin Flp